ncbi:hypothetical protein ACLOJK_005013 [Asimina triloba]
MHVNEAGRHWKSSIYLLMAAVIGASRIPTPTLFIPHSSPSPSHEIKHQQHHDVPNAIPLSVTGPNPHAMLPPSPTSHDYAHLIESCKCVHMATQIHAHALKMGFHGHEFLETKLLQMYGRHGCVDNAMLLFEKMPIRNVYSWAGALTVCVDHGLFEVALLLFERMLFEEADLEFFIFPVVLKASSGLGDLGLGEQLHGLVIKRQFVSNKYVGNALIDMYGKCGCLHDAKMVLETMPERDCVSWNSIVTACAANGMAFEALEYLEKMESLGDLMPNIVSWSAAIGGFTQTGYDEEALELFRGMLAAGVEPNARTLATVLPACARLKAWFSGREIHGYIMRHEYMSNAFVINGLLDVYRRCGDMGNALNIFLKFSVRNIVAFNTMIVGYCENSEVGKAKELFDKMKLVGIDKDTITWNSMISGYVDNRQFEEALNMFKHMQTKEGVEADTFTLGSALTACADMAALRQGKQIHSYAISRRLQSNAFVGGALVEMYCRCHDLAAAQMVFNGITDRDLASWNALISGYSRCNKVEDINNLLHKMRAEGLEPNAYTWNGIIAGHIENGHVESVLRLFSKMQSVNLKPDIYTLGMALHSCSSLATIEPGKQLHAHSIRQGYDTHVHIGATLVDMYAKCGSIRHAWRSFNGIHHQNLVSRNTMLAGYAMHGCGKEGIALFHKMLEDGIRPDSVTFLSVLSLCAHLGSVKEVWECFDLMAYYDIEPTLKHYSCLVDLLSRAGHLSEAYELIKKMPVTPDAVIWGSLLSSCVIHGNVGLGEIAASKLIELDGKEAGNYVLLANLYASLGRLDDFSKIRHAIKSKRMQKIPGCSWIEYRDQIHVFLASDRSHEQTDEIYELLRRLTLNMRSERFADPI